MPTNETIQMLIEVARKHYSTLAEQAEREDRLACALADNATVVKIEVIPDYDYEIEEAEYGTYTNRPDWYSGRVIIDRQQGQDYRGREPRYWQSGDNVTLEELRRSYSKMGYARHDAWLLARKSIVAIYERMEQFHRGDWGFYGLKVVGLSDAGDEVWEESCWGFESDYLSQKFPAQPFKLGDKGASPWGMRYKYAGSKAASGLADAIYGMAPVTVEQANELAGESLPYLDKAEIDLWHEVSSYKRLDGLMLVVEQVGDLRRIELIDGEGEVVEAAMCHTDDLEYAMAGFNA